MRIREMLKRTGFPKETIHFYIRERLLPEPRKSGVNAAETNERYPDQIRNGERDEQ
jgi:DNA-binding transcriptional MerR regulator